MKKPPAPVDPLLSMDPHEIASDLFSIICSFQVLSTEFSVSEAPFGSPEHVEEMQGALDKFLTAVEPLVNVRKLSQWVRPMHPYQTGMVSGRAASVAGDVENLKATFARFAKDVKTDPNMKSALREYHKNLLSDLYYVYGGIEVAFPEYLASQIDNTSLSVQGCMEKALQNDIAQYEVAYRLCITESIKLARIANTKGFQTPNVDVQKELGDSAFTSLRASAVLTNLGRNYMSEHSEQSVQSMAQIAKALVGQYQKISELSKVDSSQTDSLFTPEVVASYHAAYDAACKLLADSSTQYQESSEADQTITNICQKLIEEVPTFKETLTSPNTKKFAKAVENISRYIQLLVIHVSSLLQPDTDAPIYHMCLNGMFAALHYTIQLNIASSCKALYHPIIPPELSALCSIRLMFGTLGVVLVNALPALTSGTQSNPTDDNYDGLDMVTASICVPNSSIIDVLHYGRPLIIRDEPKPVLNAISTEPESVNSILNALEDDLGLARGQDAMLAAGAGAAATSGGETKTTTNPLGAPPSSVNPLGAAPVMSPTNANKPVIVDQGKSVRPSLSDFSKGMDAPKYTVSPTTAQKTPAAATSSSTFSSATTATAASSTPAAATTKVEAPKPAAETTPAASSSAPAATSSADVGPEGEGPPGAPKPWTTMPADQIDEFHLPPGYPPIPPKVSAFEKGGSEDAYKKWMVDRYNREAAENALIVYKRKLKAAQQSVGIN